MNALRPSTTVAMGKNEIPVRVLADVEASTLRAHLAGDHAMPAVVLDAHEPAELEVWHTAEHRTRDPHESARAWRHAGHLDHTHPSVHPVKVAA